MPSPVALPTPKRRRSAGASRARVAGASARGACSTRSSGERAHQPNRQHLGLERARRIPAGRRSASRSAMPNLPLPYTAVVRIR